MGNSVYKKLLPGEELISVVDELKHAFRFVPDQGLHPYENSDIYKDMIVGLTNHRLIMWFDDGSVLKWFYTSTIQSLTERRINNRKPNWPYQAKLIFAGGLGLIVQTKKVDKDKQEELSSLLVQAFIRFSIHGEDTGAIAAISAYEEIKRRQRDD